MKVSIKVDNISPLIDYRGPWRLGTSSDDPEAFKYSDNGTFHVADSNSASAAVNFYGHQITLFGAKRFNHDGYTVSIDGGQATTLNGQSEQPQFQTPLYTSPSLVEGPHTFIVQDASTDPNRPFFDLDFLVLDSEVEGDSAANFFSDSAFWSYEPLEAWASKPPAIANAIGESSLRALAAGATATLSFTGSALDLYGLVCPQCGLFGVSVDGGEQQLLNAFSAEFTRPRSVLYMARGLEDKPHNLTVTNLATGLGLDYAVVYGSRPDEPNKFVPPIEQTGTTVRTAMKLSHIGLIIAAVIIPIFCMVAAIMFTCRMRGRSIWPFPLRRRKRDHYAKHARKDSFASLQPSLNKNSPMDDPEMAMAGPRPLMPQPSILDGRPPAAYNQPTYGSPYGGPMYGPTYAAPNQFIPPSHGLPQTIGRPY